MVEFERIGTLTDRSRAVSEGRTSETTAERRAVETQATEQRFSRSKRFSISSANTDFVTSSIVNDLSLYDSIQFFNQSCSPFDTIKETMGCLDAELIISLTTGLCSLISNPDSRFCVPFRLNRTRYFSACINNCF